VRPSVIGRDPYDPGPSYSAVKAEHGLDELAKLNWNEDLFGLFPGVAEAVVAELPNIWAYPEQAYADFRGSVAGWVGTDPERIVPAHGIQALVASLAAACVEPGTTVVVGRPSYGLYAQVCAAAGAAVERVPARADHALDLEGMAAAARRTGARIVWVCDPNNPTGTLAARDEWEAFLDALPDGCFAVADEAYADFVPEELRLGRERDVEVGRPVVVLRTFSKLFGLAGLRLGFAVCDPAVRGFLDVVTEPFGVNRAALAAGRAVLDRPDEIEARRARAIAARTLLQELLSAAAMTPVPSAANFVLAHVGVDARRLAGLLVPLGYLVRPGTEYGLPEHVRVTIGPEPQMRGVVAAMAEVRAALAA